MDNIIINFSSDPSGLQPGINALDQLEQKDKDVAAQAKKTMDAYNSRDKAVTDSSQAAKQSIDSLADSMKNLDKSIVGGIGGKALSDLRNNIKLTDTQWKQFYQNIISNSKLELVSATSKEDIVVLNELINGAERSLAQFGNTQDQVTEKSKSMKSQLRELKDELQRMEDAGLENTATFEQMQIKAGKLEDQISDTNARIHALGSNTFVFDALISGVTGLTGAFAAVQGAEALFGDQTEETQKALLKVNAAMSILQGLQAIQNVLQKQSAASIAIDLVLRRNHAAATTAQAIATTAETTATEAATVAQEGLGLAFLATPTGLILTGIAAITVAIFAFGSSAEAAAKKYQALQDRLKDQLDLSIKANNIDPALATQDQIIKSLEKQIDAKKALGASDAEISAMQLQLTDQRVHREETLRQSLIKTGQDLKLSYGDANTELIKLFNRQKEISTKQKELQSQTKDQEIAAVLNHTLAQQVAEKDDLAREKKSNASRIALLEGYTSAVKTNNDTLVDLSGQREQEIAEIERKGFLDSLKSATAFAESRVIIAKDGSKQELKAQIDAIHARQNEELADANITAGERAKIVAQGIDDIAKLQNAFDVKAIKNAQTAVEAKVVAAEKGTQQELDLKLASLELGHKAEITDKTKTVEDLKLIDAKYLSDREQLIKNFNKQVAEDTINARIAELNSTISLFSVEGVGQTNQKLLDAKKQLIDEQGALEIVSIQNSVDNEELRAAKIKAVYDKELADKKQLERDKVQAEIEATLASTLASIAKAVDQNKLDLLKKGKQDSDQARDAEFDAEQKKIDASREANFNLLQAKAIDNDEFRKREDANDQAQRDLQYREEVEQQARITQVREFAQSTAINLIQFAFDQSKKGYEAEAQQVRDLFDQKQISQTEYNNRLREIRRKQAQDDKEQAIFTTLIQQGPTLLTGFKTGGLVGVAAAATLFFTLLNAITRVPVPQFWKGKVRIQGPGSDTSDSIHARISRNESVINASQSKKHEEALRAINEDRYHEYLMNHELPKLYQNLAMPALPDYVTNVSGGMPGFDYDRFGQTVADKIAENPQTLFSFDEDGMQVSIRRGENLTRIRNKKLGY